MRFIRCSRPRVCFMMGGGGCHHSVAFSVRRTRQTALHHVCSGQSRCCWFSMLVEPICIRNEPDTLAWQKEEEEEERGFKTAGRAV